MLIIFFGVSAIQNESGGFETGILSGFNYFSALLVLTLTIIAVFTDKTAFGNNRKLYQLLPSFTGIVIIGFASFMLIRREYISNLKTIITVRNLPSVRNTWKFEFKENNWFLLTDMNMFGSVMYQGKYKRVNDSLFILRSNFSTEKKFPKTGFLKNDTLYWAETDTMIVSHEQ
ncbi:MAG: hypothetical protein J0L56_14670 [Chitinophagales bacterium]|nr:hypothetical protein [Chitinophagales bacterium]